MSRVVLATAVVGCATAPPPKLIPSIPPDWSVHVDLEQAKCEPISARFANLGEHRVVNEPERIDGLLAENVLARQLPTRQPATAVELRSDTKSNQLTAEVIGQVRRKIAIEVSCDGGWHTFSFERSGTRAGRGVEEKRFRHAAYFRQDTAGRLLARVLTEAEFTSDFGTSGRESAENWYRFEPVATAVQ